ncbi:MAG: citramalate synthase [Christensenellales bacterium]|jgi:2-isopropylmalate synthase
MRRVEIFDSTLRDGAQGEGISFSVRDKLNIVRALDNFGISYIEAGNPGSNPKDIEFFERAGELDLKSAQLCAFGSTRRIHLDVEQDENVVSLLRAKTPVVSIFGKAWDLHVTAILKATLEQNIQAVGDTLAFFKSHGKQVVFDAEHFFDGYAANESYAMQVLSAARASGADVLCLCDTNGGTHPDEIARICAEVCAAFLDLRVGIHCHDDIGCAVANSLLAVEAGISHVQGTFAGFGERCGNADLSVIIPSLQLKRGYDCIGDRMEQLTSTAYRIADIANMRVRNDKAYVGRSAFAHKGGMHVDGVSKLSSSFEHINPEAVGNDRRFLASEVSGRTTVLAKIGAIVPELTKKSPKTSEILEKLKELEHQGYQFEAADASFEMMVLRVLGKFKPHFSLILYKTTGEYPAPDGSLSASAMIQVKVGGRTEMAAALGAGPVHALDRALRKALQVFYPQVANMHLTDYKVRVLGTEDATAAKVRVLIESSDGEQAWTTVGVSQDIIEASWQALSDSIEYKLTMDEMRKGGLPDGDDHDAKNNCGPQR